MVSDGFLPKKIPEKKHQGSELRSCRPTIAVTVPPCCLRRRSTARRPTKSRALRWWWKWGGHGDILAIQPSKYRTWVCLKMGCTGYTPQILILIGKFIINQRIPRLFSDENGQARIPNRQNPRVFHHEMRMIDIGRWPTQTISMSCILSFSVLPLCLCLRIMSLWSCWSLNSKIMWDNKLLPQIFWIKVYLLVGGKKTISSGH